MTTPSRRKATTYKWARRDKEDMYSIIRTTEEECCLVFSEAEAVILCRKFAAIENETKG